MKSELKCLFIDAEVPSSKQVINYLVHCQNLNVIYNIVLLISNDNCCTRNIVNI